MIMSSINPGKPKTPTPITVTGLIGKWNPTKFPIIFKINNPISAIIELTNILTIHWIGTIITLTTI